jgi:hypothetical protein
VQIAENLIRNDLTKEQRSVMAGRYGELIGTSASGGSKKGGGSKSGGGGKKGPDKTAFTEWRIGANMAEKTAMRRAAAGVRCDMKRRGVTSFLQEGRAGVFDLVEDPLPETETVETAPIPQLDEQIAVSEEVKTDRVKSKPSKSFAPDLDTSHHPRWTGGAALLADPLRRMAGCWH